MCLSLSERKAVIVETSARYQKSSRSQKKLILNQAVELTELNRNYLSWVLSRHGKSRVVYENGRRVVLKADVLARSGYQKPRIYGEELLAPLSRLWEISEYLCGKRLCPFVRAVLPGLYERAQIRLSPDVFQKLMVMSPATMDRILIREKIKYRLKGRSTTKRGTLLKHQIPIRTSHDWNETVPGFLEVDLVSHDGGLAKGDWCYTLTTTDIASTWTELRAVQNRAQCWTLEAMKDIQSHLPFVLKGIDSDSGGEFINAHFVQFCTDSSIQFTRSRPSRKNDNCFVEQKNDSVVRKTVGYFRYEGTEACEILNRLYENVNLHVNYFQPSMKLKSKKRIGSRVTKIHHPPMTPMDRLLANEAVSEEDKNALRKKRASLDIIQIHKEIKRGLRDLLMIKKK